MGGVQSAAAAAANGALSTYQWRAAACALIIHMITIEQTHPEHAPWRIHGVHRPSRTETVFTWPDQAKPEHTMCISSLNN